MTGLKKPRAKTCFARGLLMNCRCRVMRHDLDAVLLPPDKPPIASKKPKLYHPPLLWISYMLTLFEKSEMMKVIGEIIPCHRPSQKPAIFPFEAAMCAAVFGPAAQPARNRTTNDTKYSKCVFFIVFSPLRCGSLRWNYRRADRFFR